MKFKSTVTALLAVASISLPTGAFAQDRLADLLDKLAEAESAAIAARLERDVQREWSKSGSAAMDLLLKRGQDALEVDDLPAALDHLTALTDHAPDFAEGWHALALAYYQSERFGPAMDALERTLALNPDHFGALRGVGAVMEQVGQPERAYDAYSRVLALRPFDEDVQAALDRLEVRVKGTSL
ncbi:tetratricopeptide repeat protein [Aestuariicoccus sp. MJ-SS9]|uniref:tetratricopeptide repeat protein n=1 Tax=Aestuariicoccus sp. MJ-SS9 TaxID=3079855 RepID=UPI0029104600|nr:tetratricopeptide repeat protein [Aestuariicoccus sp. MJ-SS9]MDU8913786.1 tetratricopeptide repeat protein [Aestuariicoccus sp. MJ-SS9]